MPLYALLRTHLHLFFTFEVEEICYPREDPSHVLALLPKPAILYKCLDQPDLQLRFLNASASWGFLRW